MKTTMLLSAALLIGCSRPAPVEQRVSKLPTATEVFNLRNQCAALADKLDESLPYGSNWSRTTTSNYSAKANRCYVELFDHNTVTNEFSRNLYDGQTRDLLAMAKNSNVGMIYVETNIDTTSDCHPGGDCGFWKANDFMSKKMRREDEDK